MLSGFCVLVVEDEYYQAHDCCEWLRSAGATVAGPVRNAADARHILARAKVDAVVVDINLGGGPDFELASYLTETRVPFIFATGYSQENIPAEFHHALTLQKPLNSQELIIAVASLRWTPHLVRPLTEVAIAAFCGSRPRSSRSAKPRSERESGSRMPT